MHNFIKIRFKQFIFYHIIYVLFLITSIISLYTLQLKRTLGEILNPLLKKGYKKLLNK